MDLPDGEAGLELFNEQLDEPLEIIQISSITGEGIPELLYKIADKLEEVEQQMNESNITIDEREHRVVYRHEKSDEAFTISRADDGAYVVSGEAIERLFKMTDFNREAAIRRFARQMRGMGIDDALRKKGAVNGDTVRILEADFEFIE